MFRTDTRTLKVLGSAGVFSEANLSIYTRMVGLRNRLIHTYEQVDDAIIHQIFTSQLSDFGTYLAEITAFLYRK